MRLNTRLREYVFIVYMKSKPHSLYCYVGTHNRGTRALGNRIHINMFIFFLKTSRARETAPPSNTRQLYIHYTGRPLKNNLGYY
jgi:hypothetical protein